MKLLTQAAWIFMSAAPLAAREAVDAAGAPDLGNMELAVAMDLYEGRKYPEARDQFRVIRERFSSQSMVPGNPSSLARFYQMECLRKLGDLDGLANASVGFEKTSLLRKHQQRQVELNALWRLVRDKDWKQVEALAREFPQTTLAPDQRAQVAYCRALACEAQARPGDALMAYQTAITADAGASEDITRLATLGILRIHLSDPTVQSAMEVWGTPLEERESIGYLNLVEAAALASLFHATLGAGSPLPPELAVFAQYQSPDSPARAGDGDN